MDKEALQRESQSRKDQFVLTLQSILIEADQIVWSKLPHQPVVFSPNIDFYLTPGNIQIHPPTPSAIPIHPDIKPVWRKQIVKQYNEANTSFEAHKQAAIDPTNRKLIFHPDFALYQSSRRNLSRILYHEMGESIFSLGQTRKPISYSREEEKQAIESLVILFEKDKRPTIGQTMIEQYGFRRILFTSNGFGLCDLDTQSILDKNEIFPIVYELVTEQLLVRKGNLFVFENDIRKGKVDLTEEILNPNFAKVLFDTHLPTSPFTILQACMLKDWHKAQIFLSQTHPGSEEVLDKLLTAIDQDNRQIYQTNSRYRRSKQKKTD